VTVDLRPGDLFTREVEEFSIRYAAKEDSASRDFDEMMARVTWAQAARCEGCVILDEPRVEWLRGHPLSQLAGTAEIRVTGNVVRP